MTRALSLYELEPAADVAERLLVRHAVMVFAADDLWAWLIFIIADAGRKKLTSLILGSEQERALQSAAAAAVQRAAEEVSPDDTEQAEELALIISEVFRKRAPGAPLAEQSTVLEALEAGIAAQLAVLDDASLTGTGQSSAQVLDVAGADVAAKLTRNLLMEIVVRGSQGGPLEPLANQLDHDRSYLQGLRTEGKVDRLAEAMARLDPTHAMCAVPVALVQLPAATADFTGRNDELTALAGVLVPAGSAGAVVVSAVAGLAGVGKTALAVQAGHAAVRHGWFPGGVLFIDLHGYDDVPVEPGQALDALLRALGVAAEHIPATPEERAALYRSVLAAITAPVLVVADNTSSEAQVRPLLPGLGPHKVLVTSRHTLAGLGARLVDVAILDEEASICLLDRALTAARPNDDRITNDREAAARLAYVCGGLPLALHITAAIMKAEPTLNAAELADQLSSETERLAALQYDDGSGMAAPSVAAAFRLSYRRLDDAAARMFRLLAICPGPDMCIPAAATVSDVPITRARVMLRELARAHLIEPAPGKAGRWQMHDLVHLYAVELSDAHAEEDRREDGRDRLLGYYLNMTEAADAHLRALPAMDVPDAFTGRNDALAWLDAERPSLVAAVTMAGETFRDQAALRLPLLLLEYFSWRRRFDEWITTTTISLAAARQLGDRASEGMALTSLGSALQGVRRFGEAITAHQDAASIAREIGDRASEGMALTNLGSALVEVGRFEEAITTCQDAASIAREIGHQRGEDAVLTNLGVALREVGRFEEAVAAHQEALVICRGTGDRHSEAGALTNLAAVLLEMRRFEDSIAICQDAASIFQETGDRQGEGMVMNNLGLALRGARRYEEAIIAHQEDLSICRETGDRYGEATALGNLGDALMEVWRCEEAIVAYQDAAVIYRETGDYNSERSALDDLEAAKEARAT